MLDTINILYDHYKDTCSTIGEAIKRRDRLIIFVLLTTGFFALQSIFPSVPNQFISDYLMFRFGSATQINPTVLGSVIWILLLIFTMRYFQVAIFIERQYGYIHEVENKINVKLGDEFITREGKAYLSKYPIFSDWMWVLYTIIFPILLLVIAIIKITGEWKAASFYGITSNLIFNSVIALLLVISVILYLKVIHFKNKKSKNEK